MSLSDIFDGMKNAQNMKFPENAPFGLGKKNKNAPEEMSTVPMATGGFYQPIQSDARSQLLQTMMQRSRAGRGGAQ